MSDLRLGVHDASRIEWAISVPLPQPPAGEREYEIEYTVEVPANLYTVHNVWDHKQTFTRLTSPSEEGPINVDRRDMDELRRDTLGVTHRIKMLRKSFENECAASADCDKLEGHVTQAVEVVAEMRRNLDRPPSDVSQPHIVPEMRAEWALADEFLSHQLLEFLGGSTRCTTTGNASRAFAASSPRRWPRSWCTARRAASSIPTAARSTIWRTTSSAARRSRSTSTACSTSTWKRG
jgi:hypothetical protein